MAYRLVHSSRTPEWQTYEGEGEVCVHYWDGYTTATALANATNESVRDYGGTPLSIRIWREGDRWKVESVVHGSPILPWAAILGLIKLIIIIGIIILLVWAARVVLTGVRDIVWGPPPIINPDTGEVEWEPTPIIPATMIPILVGAAVVGGGIYLLTRTKGKAPVSRPA